MVQAGKVRMLWGAAAGAGDSRACLWPGWEEVHGNSVQFFCKYKTVPKYKINLY